MVGSFLRRPPTRIRSGPPAAEVATVVLTAGARSSSESAAFAELYKQYFDSIYWYCRRRLPTAEAAEDAAAHVFANALAAGPRWTDPSLRSWLFSIAHNVVANALRAGGLHPTESLDAASSVADGGPPPEQAAIVAEERDELRQAIAMLPEDQRTVVELRMAGLTGPEVARVMGRSHAAVKMLQLRAYSRLRDLLRDEADPERRVRHD
jgi:RNA polymerase sigma-70 factor (ECF subfamily)